MSTAASTGASTTNSPTKNSQSNPSQNVNDTSSSSGKNTNAGTGTGTSGANDDAKKETTEVADAELGEDVAYDQDDMPIPQGIVSVNEDELDQNESLDLNLDNSNNQVWLVKLTPQLASLWKNEEFLNGQLLGNIKIPKTSVNDPKNANNTQTDASDSNLNHLNASTSGASSTFDKKNKILLELNNDIPEHKNLDKEYEIRLVKQIVDNEYAFSESQFEQFRQRLMYRTQVVSLPNQPRMRTLNKEALNHEAQWTRKIRNYKKEAQYREMRARDPNYKTKRSESGMGTTYLSDDENDNNSNDKHRRGNSRRNAKFEKFEKFRKFIPYAKTIPKKTEIVGKVVHECQVIPTQLVADNRLRMLEQKKRLNQMVKRKTINYLKSERVGVMHGRTTPNIQTGSTITLSKELAMKKEIAKQDGRAARMERDVLMTLLFKLFNEYEYWTMKGLREKTSQPETYLKECLESIAVMERKGPYALKWRLKDEYRKSIDVEKKVKRGAIEDDEDANSKKEEEDDEDMDDIEMEDIAAV